ncbi:alpha/beta fold hydrolase [Kordiimonas sp. SCSIO 12610]|uniref:alpha/beta fold hydrolase n=1 Tax=Kordiimonas sp. SCSIO 12610 TaxID=2829597 RepID=UPI00210C9A85|nr:alpha/beta hydrolase [Kordiimonas sp. SCSIO 12610]UTW55490.1 alpha/beta hydrolase [Kordiimonas sp. SCSIO 12610]
MIRFLIQKAILIMVLFGVSLMCQALDVRKYGDYSKPALVFLPGLASDGALWDRWVEKYKDTHAIFVLHAPGFAGTAAKEETEGFLGLRVEELANVLRESNVQEAYVVGHSIGGLMSLMLAERYPDLVKKTLVVDSIPFLAGLFVPGISPEQAGGQAKFLGKQMQALPRDTFLAQQRQSLTTLLKSQDFLPTLIKWSEKSDQATVAKAFMETFGLDYRQNLKNIRSDVTVLAAYAPEMPLSKVDLQNIYREQYADLDTVEIRMVDDSFHFIMIDQENIFDQILTEFLK